MNKRCDTAIELLRAGKSTEEVATIMGITKRTVYKHAYYRGYNLRDGCREKHQKITKSKDEIAKGYVESRMLPFEFAGVYTGSDGVIGLKCKVCGNTATYPTISVRKGCNIQCSYCRTEELKRHKEEQAQERERQIRLRALEKEDREREKARDIKCTQLQMNVCPVCGTVTTNPVYCSIVCRNRMNNRVKETRRRVKINAQMVDKDITLEALYIRDGGKCYMCGKSCDWSDFIYMGETKVVGNSYPSIDHVIPLSKGGAHAWSNVRLACKGCNQVKGDDLHSPLV